MKIKPKPKAAPPTKVAPKKPVVIFDEEDEFVRPKTKAKKETPVEEDFEESVSSGKRNVVMLKELDNDTIYEVRCDAIKKFGWCWRPAFGIDLKRRHRNIFDIGAVHAFLTNPQPKGGFFVELPEPHMKGEHIYVREAEKQQYPKLKVYTENNPTIKFRPAKKQQPKRPFKFGSKQAQPSKPAKKFKFRK